MPNPDDSETAAAFEAEGIPGLDDEDPAIGGMVPPRDEPLGAEEFGVTQAEERRGETLAERVRREEPDFVPGAGAELADELGEGTPVGRLLDAEPGPDGIDVTKEVTADEVTDGETALAPEEAAMRRTDNP
jgi:hypothetical protein